MQHFKLYEIIAQDNTFFLCNTYFYGIIGQDKTNFLSYTKFYKILVKISYIFYFKLNLHKLLQD